MAKPLAGARACRTIGRDVGAVEEMRQRGVITDAEAADLSGRLLNELESIRSQGRMNEHQYAKVRDELAANGV